MSNILTIGLFAEGTTDDRFLVPIIKRTFDNIALQCEGEIEIFDPIILKPATGNSFVEQVEDVAHQAEKQGIRVLCVHTDADNRNDAHIRQYKIDPAWNLINSSTKPICKTLVSIVPVQMMEAWILADFDLLQEEIGTKFSSNQLSLNRNPESYSDPKKSINQAIKKVYSNKGRRRRKQLSLGRLYLPIAQKMCLDKLRKLSSYAKFEKEVLQAFRMLNFTH